MRTITILQETIWMISLFVQVQIIIIIYKMNSYPLHVHKLQESSVEKITQVDIYVE